MNVLLTMVKGDGTQRQFPLTRARIVVGRVNTCDLRIPLPSVSRQHCEITIQGAEVRLRDLGSSNGTYHNGSRVQEATLKAGDEIGVGPVVFKLALDGQPAASEAPPAAAKPGSPLPPKGQALDQSGEDEVELVEVIEDEGQTPTIDLDDPALALDELAGPGPAKDDSVLPLLEEDPPKPNSTPK